MRSLFFLLVASLSVQSMLAQSYSSAVEIVTVYSQNGHYYLRSTPWDDESPSLHGITHVFAKGSPSPLYSLSRGFDSVDDDSNNLILSDDGNTIIYLLTWGANDERDGLKSISIYSRGELVRSYTVSEVTGCDLEKERCTLAYNNYNEVVDRKGSKWGTGEYRKTFKTGINEQEKFLSDFAIFSSEGVVYLTDSKKQLHTFSMKDGKHLNTRPFSEAYETIKSKGRFNVVDLQLFESPLFGEFPPLRSGVETANALGSILGMKPYDTTSTKDEKYKKYGFTVSGYLHGDGSFHLTEIDLFSDLPRMQIVEFFARNRFAVSSIPKPVDRWFLKEKYFFLRKADRKVAVKERQDEIRSEREALQKRFIAESIDGRYIPKDLGDAFVQLDKELSEVDRNEIAALSKPEEMITYHMGLGMWMRNNWGLWGGSRLQKYFTDKGVNHPDDMSGVILRYYYDWLHGNKESWKIWEKKPK